MPYGCFVFWRRLPPPGGLSFSFYSYNIKAHRATSHVSHIILINFINITTEHIQLEVLFINRKYHIVHSKSTRICSFDLERTVGVLLHLGDPGTVDIVVRLFQPRFIINQIRTQARRLITIYAKFIEEFVIKGLISISCVRVKNIGTTNRNVKVVNVPHQLRSSIIK